MTFSPAFFRAGAACALGSALTTFLVHLYPRPETAEEAMRLYDDPVYLLRSWIVIGHILLAVASMWAAIARRLDRAAGPLGLALFGYLLFGLAELSRMSLHLFAVNRTWKAGVATTDDPLVRERLMTLLDGFGGLNEALFFLLIFGFFLGNLFLGSVLVRGAGLERAVGVALLIWAALGLQTILNDPAGLSWVPGRPGWVSWTFQPAVRVLVAAWLWRAATEPAGGGAAARATS